MPNKKDLSRMANYIQSGIPAFREVYYYLPQRKSYQSHPWISLLVAITTIAVLAYATLFLFSKYGGKKRPSQSRNARARSRSTGGARARASNRAGDSSIVGSVSSYNIPSFGFILLINSALSNGIERLQSLPAKMKGKQSKAVRNEGSSGTEERSPAPRASRDASKTPPGPRSSRSGQRSKSKGAPAPSPRRSTSRKR